MSCSEKKFESTLDVVMTGKSIQTKTIATLKESTSSKPCSKSAAKVGENSQCDETLMKTKPAILVSSNTTKSMKLGRRKPPPTKKVNLPKYMKKQQKKTKEVVHEPLFDHEGPLILQNSNGSLVDISTTPVEMRSSTLDIGRSLNDNLKKFEEMDNEFYDIMKEMNIDQVKSQFSRHNRSSESSIDSTHSEMNTVTEPGNQIDENLLMIDLKEKSCLNFKESKNLSIVNLKIKSTENILKITSTRGFIDQNSKQYLIESRETNKENNEAVSEIITGTNFQTLEENNEINDEVAVKTLNLKISSDNVISNESSQEYFEEVEEEEFDQLNDHLKTRKVQLNERLLKKHEIPVDGNEDFFNKKVVFDKNNRNTAHYNIHHFCTTIPTTKLNLQQKLHSQFTHTPDKFKTLYTNKFKDFPFSLSSSPLHSNTLEDEESIMGDIKSISEDSSRYTEIATKIMSEIEEKPNIKENLFMKLQYVVDEMFEKKADQEEKEFHEILQGHCIQFKDDMSRVVHNPPPPKFHIPPEVVRDTLAPEYESKMLDEDVLGGNESQMSDIDEAAIIEKMSSKEKQDMERILNRNYHSMNDLHLIEDEEESTSDEELLSLGLSDRFESILDMQRRKKKIRPSTAESFDLAKQVLSEQRRSQSQPNFQRSHQSYEQSIFTTDFNATMKELEDLSIKLKEMKVENSEHAKIVESTKYLTDEKIVSKSSKNRKQRLIAIKKSIEHENVKFLVRSQSIELLEDKNRLERCKSVNDISELENLYHLSDRSQSEVALWLKENFWYKWLDEIYLAENNDLNEDDNLSNENDSCSGSISNTIWKDEITIIADSNTFRNKILQKEIDKLSNKINKLKNNKITSLLGFHLCRRGACYRKIGDLKNSLLDLNRAIDIEPKLLDSYWHRHLIYLIQDNTKKALEDLTHISTYNPKHTNAFRSKAEIHKKKGDIAFAITSYSQAISTDKRNADLYYARAELLEERGDIILALEDYKSADQIHPKNTAGILKIALYHFKIGSWIASVSDFTDIISRETLNGDAYLCRARSYAKINQHEKAIIDLSICINLQPDNYLAFYHRGCLLRRYQPQQALQDLCVSLLLDPSKRNINAYLHRGILYTDLNMLDQARSDFEVVIRLNGSFAPAHVNLGLIEMKQNKNYRAAIRRFNVALRVNPTYTRAIICRAEAHESLSELDCAINDYTRAIVMRPSNVDYRMARGRLLLKKDHFELASFHIRQCASMTSSKVGLSTQQAVVETFLKNYDKAINILEVTVKSQPIVHLYTLLGKTLMKARKYHEAINQLNEALEIMRPWNCKIAWPVEASETFFLIAMCFVELKTYQSALDAFNSAVRINSDYPQAYYQRGLVRMKLGLSKGVHDFNKALACQPTFYQAYLARAAYYSMNKRYAKAIMNCNEAVKIKPQSVRAFLYRGAIKYHIKAYGLAIKDLTAALTIDCNCWLAYFNRAVCYHEKKFYFKAIKDYSLVLMSSSNLKMKALLNRGLLYYQIDDINNAVFDLKSALEEHPCNVEVNHALGLCYQRLGKLSLSVEAYTNVLQIDPFCIAALLGRGNVFIKDSENDGIYRGRKDFIRALHLNPQSAEARVNLAFGLQMEGSYMKAWNLFTKTLNINPNYAAALEGRALVSLHMGNTFGAFVDMNAAVKLCQSAQLLTNRGVVNQCMGDIRSAMNDYQMAIRIDPSFSLAYYNAANLYFMHRQFSQAISFYCGAINWNPMDANAHLNRAVAKSVGKDLNGSRDVDGALDDFKAAAKLAVTWSSIYFNRGNLFHSVKRYDEAEKDFNKGISLQPTSALMYKKRADTRGKLGYKDAAINDYRRSITLVG